jgi:hypothetical protein
LEKRIEAASCGTIGPQSFQQLGALDNLERLIKAIG